MLPHLEEKLFDLITFPLWQNGGAADILLESPVWTSFGSIIQVALLACLFFFWSAPSQNQTSQNYINMKIFIICLQRVKQPTRRLSQKSARSPAGQSSWRFGWPVGHLGGAGGLTQPWPKNENCFQQAKNHSGEVLWRLSYPPPQWPTQLCGTMSQVYLPSLKLLHEICWAMVMVELPLAQNPRWLLHCVTYIHHNTCAHVGLWDKFTWQVWSYCIKWSLSCGNGWVTPQHKIQDGSCTMWPAYIITLVKLESHETSSPGQFEVAVWSHLRAMAMVEYGILPKMATIPVAYICHFTRAHPGARPKSTCKVWSFCAKSSLSQAVLELPLAQNPRWPLHCVTYIHHYTHVHAGPWDKFTWQVWSHCMKLSLSCGNGWVTPHAT